jgi:hypothetical protein
MSDHFAPPVPSLDPVFVAAMKDRRAAGAVIAASLPATELSGGDLRAHSAGFAAPTPREREIMLTHGIQFDGYAYRYAGMAYERLADAVSHARRTDGWT